MARAMELTGRSYKPISYTLDTTPDAATRKLMVSHILCAVATLSCLTAMTAACFANFQLQSCCMQAIGIKQAAFSPSQAPPLPCWLLTLACFAICNIPGLLCAVPNPDVPRTNLRKERVGLVAADSHIAWAKCVCSFYCRSLTSCAPLPGNSRLAAATQADSRTQAAHMHADSALCQAQLLAAGCLSSVCREAITCSLRDLLSELRFNLLCCSGLLLCICLMILLHAGQAMQDAQEDDNKLVRDPIAPRVMVQIRDMAGAM